MKDRRMKALGLFAALSLVVCLIASGIVSDANSSYAATSSLKWTQISIPDEDDMQLYPGYDIGPMAVSPDGSTVFAAVQNELVLTDWALMKSTNGGFGWQETGLAGAMAAIADTSDIVAVVLSPSWNTDSTIFAATEKNAYYSEDRGTSFDNLAEVPGTGGAAVITSLALGRENGNVVVAVGTSDGALGGDVYILDMAVWNVQTIGAYDVLAVGLSPSYASDSAIIAVVTDASQTRVRTKLGIAAWDAAVRDATFKDQDGLDFVSYRASIGFPSDYIAASGSSSIRVFVGLSAVGPRGDVFSIQWAGWPAIPTVADCQVRGYENPPTNTIPTETNIWSMAVSGSGASVVIIAGTEAADPAAIPSPPGQFITYVSPDGGATWSPSQSDYLSCKQPTGEDRATAVMTSSVAYVGTFGSQSAVSSASASGTGGGFSSWNQRGLVDVVIGEITDMSPSEGYFADGTIYITTLNASDASLWRTQTEGRTWERVYCSTLTGTPATCVFDTVRLVGNILVLAESNNTGIVPSFDGCVTFGATRYTSQPVTAFVIESEEIYYAGDASGGVWGSTDAGVTWATSSDSDIPTTDMIIDLVLMEDGEIYAGTNNGGVYKAGSSLAFERVGPDTPGATPDIVHVAPDPYDRNYVYVGIQGGAATQGIWRFDQSDDEAEWERIKDGVDISSIVCEEQDGILYAISSSTGIGLRSVDPTTTKSAPEFQDINNGLEVGDSVLRGLKLIPNPTFLFAIGGASYTQLWITSDEMVRMKLLAPEDGSESGIILEDEVFLGRAMVRLEWKEIEGAKTYEVQLAFDEDFISPVDDSYYDGGTHESTGLLKMVYPWLGTKYYWRVRVIDPYMSQWSEPWSFITPLGPALSMPVLLSPEPGSEGVSLRPLLQWSSSVAATGYELILTKNCDWSNPVLNLYGDNAVNETAYQVTFDLAKNTNYCWKVRGVNDITNSPWSDSLSFTTGSTVVTENEGLPIWVWVIIALGSILMLAIIVLIVHSRSG
ncbi:MAG: hypothetical protein WC562_08940 [Dehalococcoidia bacterium]